MSSGYVTHKGKEILVKYERGEDDGKKSDLGATVIYIYKDEIYESPASAVKCSNCDESASQGNKIGCHQVCQACFILGISGKLTESMLTKILWFK